MPTDVPRRAGMSDADVLRAALEATGRSQVRLALDVLGVNDRSLRQWLAGEPTWAPVMRLAWVLAQHPEIADEIEAEFAR